MNIETNSDLRPAPAPSLDDEALSRTPPRRSCGQGNTSAIPPTAIRSRSSYFPNGDGSCIVSGRNTRPRPGYSARDGRGGRHRSGAWWVAGAVVVASSACLLGYALGRSHARGDPPPGRRTPACSTGSPKCRQRLAGRPVGTWVGSGFAVAPDEVVTARHLVIDAEQVLVRDIHGRTLPAEVVGTDARTDSSRCSAVPDAGFVPVALGIGGPPRWGHGDRHREPVRAVPLPRGRGGRGAGTTPGVDPDGPQVDFLQLSIPLNPGTAEARCSPGGPGGRRVVRDPRPGSGDRVRGPWSTRSRPRSRRSAPVSGSAGRSFSDSAVEQDGEGVRVTSVIPSSPADRAGIRAGDRLSAFDGDPIETPADLTRALDRRWAARGSPSACCATGSSRCST